MEHKPLLRFLILFLGFSYALSSNSVPQSDHLEAGNEDPSIQGFVEQGFFDEKNHGEGLELEEAIIRGRMDIECNDYPGTGANNHHDPKTPGRS